MRASKPELESAVEGGRVLAAKAGLPMSCRRATEIDAEEFLMDPVAPGLESFRAHYPTCPDCAAAVARWSAFDLALRDLLAPEGDSPSSHPEPERLVVFLADPKTMGEEAMQIESHLEGCATCRTELSVLRRFDAGVPLSIPASEALGIADPRTRNERSLSSIERGWRGRLREFFESLAPAEGIGRAAVPALAMLMLAIGVWWINLPKNETPQPAEPTSTPRLVEETAPTPPSGAPSGGEPSGESPKPAQLAGGGLDPSSQAEAQARDAREQEAQEPTEAKPERIADAPRQEGPPEEAEAGPDDESLDEILIAALTELPSPTYQAPAGMESLGWMRQFGAVRAGPSAATVETAAPIDHTGLTLSNSPRLWWRLSADTPYAVQITIVDEVSIDPLLRVELPGPHEAGSHSIDLGEQAIELEPGVDYRWFVSLLVDPDRPSRNPVSAAALRVVPENDTRRTAAAQASPAERGHTLARLGLWYDSYDFFASLAQAHPDRTPLIRNRERMMEVARATQ